MDTSKSSCSCNQYHLFKVCGHLQQAKRWNTNFDRYLAISALHKEIRRSDVLRARSWLDILLKKQSPVSVLKYIERIVFEETRNIDLFIKLKKSSLSVFEALDIITVSPKKWDLQYLNNPNSHFQNWHEGFVRSNQRDSPTPLELASSLAKELTIPELYMLYFDLKKTPELRPQIFSKLHDINQNHPSSLVQEFLKQEFKRSYEFLVLLEISGGLWSDEATRAKSITLKNPSFIPLEQYYHHDQHTSKGKSSLQQKFKNGYAARSFQFEEIDLRFSGSIFGVLFREECIKQYGSLTKSNDVFWNWSEVSLSNKQFKMALELERYFYKSDYLFNI